jgi:hypothetical protein
MCLSTAALQGNAAVYDMTIASGTSFTVNGADQGVIGRFKTVLPQSR